MASRKGDYFGLSYIVSLILAIIPFTAWICGMITRFSEGKIVAGIIRILDRKSTRLNSSHIH